MCKRMPSAGQEMQASKGGPDLRWARVKKPGQARAQEVGLSWTS